MTPLSWHLNHDSWHSIKFKLVIIFWSHSWVLKKLSLLKRVRRKTMLCPVEVPRVAMQTVPKPIAIEVGFGANGQSFNCVDIRWISFSMCSVSNIEPPCTAVQCGLRRLISSLVSSSMLFRAVKKFKKQVLFFSVSPKFPQLLYAMNQNGPSLQWKSMDHIDGPGTHPYKLLNYANRWIRNAEIQNQHHWIRLACRCLYFIQEQ